MSLLQIYIQEAVVRHGSYRAAGQVLGFDHAYLHKLATGEKDNPSELFKPYLDQYDTTTDELKPEQYDYD